jgi:hypothetical protein
VSISAVGAKKRLRRVSSVGSQSGIKVAEKLASAAFLFLFGRFLSQASI